MPIVISKRVLHTFMGAVVLVSFSRGLESYDYPYDPGRATLTDEQAIAKMESSGFMDQARGLFLQEVYLGRTPHDVEIRAA